jgi:hypothetical protein
MNDRKYLLIAAGVAAALVNAAHPLAVATDRCTAPGETLCAPELSPSPDGPEHQPARGVVERTRGEQAPPPGEMRARGQTWEMQRRDDRWPGYAAAWATLPQNGIAPKLYALGLVPPPTTAGRSPLT